METCWNREIISCVVLLSLWHEMYTDGWLFVYKVTLQQYTTSTRTLITRYTISTIVTGIFITVFITTIVSLYAIISVPLPLLLLSSQLLLLLLTKAHKEQYKRQNKFNKNMMKLNETHSIFNEWFLFKKMLRFLFKMITVIINHGFCE